MLAVRWLDSLLEGPHVVFSLAESSEETSRQGRAHQGGLVKMWPDPWPASLDWPTAKEWWIA